LVDVTEDHSLLSPELIQLKPKDVSVGLKLFHSFPTHFDFETPHSIDTENQMMVAQWKFILLKRLGYSASIHIENKVIRVEPEQIEDPCVVKNISTLHETFSGYVYDIETEAGTFQAGVGQMIVKNTDSIMVQFDVSESENKIHEAWCLGELAAAQISSLFRAPNRIVLEKIYCPYVLYSKKRYAAKMWEVQDGVPVFKKVDVKGLQTVRRDFCPYVREVCESILKSILEKCDPTEAINIAREAKKTLLDGSISMERLTITKKLGNSYETRVPHNEVVEKIKKRNPGSEPQVGSRVPFVLIKNGGTKMFEKAEDPKWVLENPKVKIDYMYYFEHQLKKSCTDLIEPLVCQGFDPFADQRKQRLLTDFFT
jgi:DNA polymerase elongation subunit (family B)